MIKTLREGQVMPRKAEGLGVFLFMVLLLSTLIPTFVSYTRPENFFLPIAIVFLAIDRPWRIPKSLLIVLLGFILSALIANATSLGASADFLMRTIKILVITAFFAQYGNVIRGFLGNWMNLFTTVLMIISMVQLVNPFGIGTAMAEWYGHDRYATIINEEYSRHFRLTGTAINPNDFAALLLIPFTWFISKYSSTKNRFLVPVLILLVVMLALTQSRTSFLAFGAVVALSFAMEKLSIRNLLIAGIIAIVGIAAMYALDLRYLQQVLNPFGSSSFQQRTETWDMLIEVWKQKPFFGHGFSIFAGENAIAPDSQYFYVLVSVGLAGSLFHLGIIILPMLILWKKRNDVLCKTIILLSAGMAVISMTNISFLNPYTGVIYFALLGIGLSVSPSSLPSRPPQEHPKRS